MIPEDCIHNSAIQPLLKQYFNSWVKNAENKGAQYWITDEVYNDTGELIFDQLLNISLPDNYDPVTVIEIKVSEYAELFSLSSHEASRDIKLAIKDLFKRSITFFIPSESTDTEMATDEYAWLSKSASRPKKGLYTLNINRELMPFMLNLKNKFTKFQLADTEKLTSPYAMRLYESLCQFKSAGVFIAKKDWLIERYQLPQSYNRYPDFKRRFLIPAIDELTSSSP